MTTGICIHYRHAAKKCFAEIPYCEVSAIGTKHVLSSLPCFAINNVDSCNSCRFPEPEEVIQAARMGQEERRQLLDRANDLRDKHAIKNQTIGVQSGTTTDDISDSAQFIQDE